MRKFDCGCSSRIGAEPLLRISSTLSNEISALVPTNTAGSFPLFTHWKYRDTVKEAIMQALVDLADGADLAGHGGASFLLGIIVKDL